MTSNKPSPFDFCGHTVFDAEDLRAFDSLFFFGCAKTIRKIIDKHNIPTSDYFFGSYSIKAGWKFSTKDNRKAKLLLSEGWVLSNIPSMRGQPQEQPQEQTKEQSQEQTKEQSQEQTKEQSQEQPEVPIVESQQQAVYEYELAPPIIELEEHEKFKDDKGKSLEIEVRGERENNKCFFKVSEVAKAFQMNNIKSTIMHKEYGYKNLVHYKTFIVTAEVLNQQSRPYREQNNPNKPSLQKTLFLTYNGMLKVLFSSRSGIAEHFQEWASRVLFTVQMGTVEQRQGLAYTMLGVSVDSFREFLSCGVTPEVSCLYLVTLGYVKDVRDDMDIPKRHKDNAMVCKFGISNNIDQRLMQHKRGFKDIDKVDMRVKCFGYIDKMYTSKAETELKHELYDGLLSDDEISVRLEYKKHTEIVVLTPLQFKHVTQSVYPNLTKRSLNNSNLSIRRTLNICGRDMN
ncbi:hypothetical protein GUITHDRAFT_121495 [Guillardia theta CCMP2712]|uniref:Bro-N domain-containing protein n=1 Tax=Guillardia theta (strain CCMP2712) TaxID=905079 RepID=L1I919_GUITC|nr:hypothetical protein GUITHDRAFT_121495 [Guillardia theta CCMP2712]EKX32325.1 hypothetical protein GUITHDRAFT_121495 [Guillardia theta CCMP2712]|eukprot:XP_005819305.1 hypothetical protein GUITHDRAFT_121495 [Guillardia theta CCMP2712]